MKFLLILIIIIIIIIIICSNHIENMMDIVPYSNENLKPDINTKCCLVEKKYLYDNKSMYAGNFKYIYNTKQNEECDPVLYNSNNNQQLLIDNVNNWSNDNCKDNKITGSCRIINNECIDFVDKKFCDNVPGMVWSEKTCNNPLEYIWQDKIIRKVPERDKDDGSYVMFPE